MIMFTVCLMESPRRRKSARWDSFHGTTGGDRLAVIEQVTLNNNYNLRLLHGIGGTNALGCIDN